MAYHPEDGLVYIPAMRNLSAYASGADNFSYLPGPHWNTGQNDAAAADSPLAVWTLLRLRHSLMS